MPKPKKIKPPKHCVLDLSSDPIKPVVVRFSDSLKDMKALAETSESYVACSLLAHPKKKVKPAKPVKKSKRPQRQHTGYSNY